MNRFSRCSYLSLLLFDGSFLHICKNPCAYVGKSMGFLRMLGHALRCTDFVRAYMLSLFAVHQDAVCRLVTLFDLALFEA